MVKKLFCAALLGGFLLAGFQWGCGKSDNPVVPANSAVLQLSLPPGILNAAASKTVKKGAKDSIPSSGMGILEYNLVTAGEAPVTGQILYNDGSTVGDVILPLPKAGKWVVSAEWFAVAPFSAGARKGVAYINPGPGMVATAEFAGADMVDVQGTTSFTLNMEDIGYQEFSCYEDNDITDPLDADYNLGGVSWYDFYTFDSGVESASVSGSTGDVEASYDTTTASTYFTAPSPPAAFYIPPPNNYAYLGNGDFVNFPVISDKASFFASTLQAKAAVLGSAGSTVVGGDIFAVKVPSTGGMAWVQFGAPNVGFPLTNGSSFNTFQYIYNKTGLPYMKFDETTNGRANCNLNP